MYRKIIHVDMDAFYASVEQRDNPAFKGKPVIVGGDREKRGVVCAASYEARRFGVHSAMPTSLAKNLCPEGIFLPVRMHRYREVSGQIFAILSRFTPLTEPLSLDESFLDVTASERLFGPAIAMAREMKRRILAATELTASAGVAPNKFLAKIASDLKKPDGLMEIKPEEIPAFLQDLPIGRLWGVGKHTEEILQKMGILRVGQLAAYPEGAIEKKLGKFGLELLALARGQDDRSVVPASDPKSISQEETFTPDLQDSEEMRRILLDQSERVGWDLRRQKMKGCTVTLKVRYPDFSLVTRSATLPFPTDQGIEIFRTAFRLLDKTEARKKKARLLGVGVSNLRHREDPEQLTIFDSKRKKVEQSLEALDRILEKFGPGSIQRASLLEKKPGSEEE
ncbi:MAG: DNA polymerase IV [Deltaproteobacteria bacterium]|nr:DNA polymerase IV [Deltaproteobacteria bacterium]